MKKINQLINKLSHNRKISLGIIVLCLVLVLSILIPTLANFIKEDTSLTTSVWDGSIANSYKNGDGSKEDPYIISNGSELAYFQYKLEDTDYSDTYFLISNNIILNAGSLRYNPETGIEYILNGNTYYVEYYTNRYYDNPEKNGIEAGTINIFPSLKNFAGYLNGNKHTIYGLYLTDSSSEELAFIQNLEGNIDDLFFKNALVYGGTTTAGLALKSDDTILNNIIYDGYVVNKKITTPKTINGSLTADSISVHNYETTNYIPFRNHLPYIGSETVSVKVTGNYEVIGSSEETTIVINGTSVTGGNFNVDLGSTLPESIPVVTSTTSFAPVTINFSNLNYEIKYNNSLTAGLIAESKNTVLKNTVNASDVYGNFICSGLIGIVSGSLEISNSYNRGLINGVSLGSGLVGSINSHEEVININNSYNSGNINAYDKGGLIGTINYTTSNISITNSFEGTEINPIAISNGAIITVTNSYLTKNESISGFVYKELNELKTETFLVETLGLNKYIDEEDYKINMQNIWVFDQDEYPLTYYDRTLNKIVRLQIGTLTFKDYHETQDKQIMKDNITFSIEEINAYDSLKTKEYFISDSQEILTQEALSQITEWTNYESIKQITDEGSYVIYVKITDYKNRISYLNSDILILDLTGPIVSLNDGKTTWNEFKEITETVYINKTEKFKINAEDDLSGIAYIKYLLTDKIYNKNELSLLDENDWLDYKDEIVFPNLGNYTVYVQVIDNANNVTYLNTNHFIYQGYVIENVYPGLANNPAYQGLPLHITGNSVMTIEAAYNEITEVKENLKHHIVSNILLPKNTKIKLIDNFNSRAYTYQITTDEDIYNFDSSCDQENFDCQKKAKYPFILFKETGRVDEKLYEEKNYYHNGKYEENFTVIVDFSETSLNANYDNVEIYFEIDDAENHIIRSTIASSIKKFNLSSTVASESSRAKVYLTTDYSDNPINLNTNSITEIDLTSGINYQRNHEFKIIDTAYEYGNLGFEIKLIDINGAKVSKEHLKNVVFQVENKNYTLGEDNTIRILGNALHSETKKTIKIITHEGDSGLTEGMYYLKISSFKTIGGYVAEDSGLADIIIPVTVSKINYNKIYDIEMDLKSGIINKTKETETINFVLKQSGELNNLTVKVSLYEKAELTAYSQKYNLIDLKDYISDSLEPLENYIYKVETSSSFSLNFKPGKFKNTGYQLIFELYDNNKRIDLVKKYFIVK